MPLYFTYCLGMGSTFSLYLICFKFKNFKMFQFKFWDLCKKSGLKIRWGIYILIFFSMRSVNISWSPKMCHALFEITVTFREFIWLNGGGKRRRQLWLWCLKCTDSVDNHWGKQLVWRGETKKLCSVLRFILKWHKVTYVEMKIK